MKQGYKQTEIGVIPEEWSIVVFNKCFKILSNNTLSRAELNDEEGLVKNVHYGDILVKYGNVLNCATEMLPYINDVNKKSNLMFLTNGDLIIADTAEDETVGKAVEIAKVGEQKVVSGLHTIPCRPISHDMFAEGWLGYYINHSIYHDQLLPFITGTKVSAVSKSAIARTLILVPPLEEQKRIAEALSDVDGMISSLEKLIAKKKAVKQGAMQELLTGKKRLPGFTEAWVEKKIEDIVVRFATGLNPRQNFKLNNGGTNYYVTIKDFREGKLFLDDACDRIDNAALERINERSDLKKNDLLFSSIGRIGDAYLITETPKNWNINESVFALRPNQQIVSPLMLYYLLTSEDVKNKLLDSTTGSTLKSIKLGHLKEITCRFPKVIEEQIAIASILSDMDSEIEALEQKLDKTRQIKQGMMQQLLTGKIRLV